MNAVAALFLSLATVSQAENVVLLEFTAEWCVPCRQMATVVDRLIQAGYPVQRIDVDRYRRLAEQWKVNSIPSYILVRNGYEQERIVGAASFDRLVRMFDRVGFPPGTQVVRAQNAPGEWSAPLDMAKQAFQATISSAAPRGTSETSTRGNVSRTTSTGTNNPNEVEQQATAATVRIRVEEPSGMSFGTGTIVHTHGDEALILTCGHLFRESQGKLPIWVDLFLPEGEHSVPARLLSYDAGERDLGLVVIKPGVELQAVKLGSPLQINAGAEVFSLGCDRGGAARLVRSRINSVDRYVGRSRYLHTIQVAGDPVDGRSGGGLFDQAGHLIGVCYAADPSDVDEGLYMGVRTIQEMLDEAGLAFVYQQTDTVGHPIAEDSPGNVVKEPQTTLDAVQAAPPAIEHLLELLNAKGELLLVAEPNHSGQGRVVSLDQQTRELLADQLRTLLRR